MSDVLIEMILRPLSRLAEWVFFTVFFLLGWPLVKLLTLGRYPRPGSWRAEKPEALWTCGAGLSLALLVMMAALGQFALS